MCHVKNALCVLNQLYDHNYYTNVVAITCMYMYIYMYMHVYVHVHLKSLCLGGTLLTHPCKWFIDGHGLRAARDHD